MLFKNIRIILQFDKNNASVNIFISNFWNNFKLWEATRLVASWSKVIIARLTLISKLISLIEIRAQIYFLLFHEQRGALNHPQRIDRSKVNRFSILQCVAHFPWRSRGDKDSGSYTVRYVIPAVRICRTFTLKDYTYIGCLIDITREF